MKPEAVELLIFDGRLNDEPQPGEPSSPARIRRETLSFKGKRLELELPPRAIVFAKYKFLHDLY